MIRRMRRMNESKIRRPSAVEDMMDDIDFLYSSDVLGVKPSRIADILGKNNASEDDSGREGYFATMSNSDIEKACIDGKADVELLVKTHIANELRSARKKLNSNGARGEAIRARAKAKAELEKAIAESVQTEK